MTEFPNKDRLSPERRETLDEVEHRMSAVVRESDEIRRQLLILAESPDTPDPEELQIAANNMEVVSEMVSGVTFERIEVGLGLDEEDG